ncbi:MAG TPA: hypothetical protein PK668_08800 [Myxococcota bacterium]|nr:hypothetical protein [Myxococcota bacterium]HRY92923.1 hypothetical protein [Myxococcota bacterium]HSA19858.1 hypothetical protein [Myxococcota bacterium]
MSLAGPRLALAFAGAALAALALGGAGCKSAVGAADKNLMEVVDRFHHDIRWKYNQQAAARVPAHQSADFLELLEGMKNDLNITAWDVRKVEYDAAAKRATVRMHLEYFLMPSTVMREVSVEQVWEEIEDSWVCLSIKGGPVELQSLPPPAAADGGPGVVSPAPAAEPDQPGGSGAP